MSGQRSPSTRDGHRSDGSTTVHMENLNVSPNSERSANRRQEPHRHFSVGRNTRQNGDRHAQFSHMTMDGRRRPRSNHQHESHPSNGDDQWNDWTSTWRRIGNKGQSQAVTMTGTITRGKRKGEQVDVQLDLTQRELLEISTMNESLNSASVPTPESLPSAGIEPKSSNCSCGINAGPHVLLLSILAFPFILFASIFVSFYFGALTWQNIFSYFYDERTIWHRIFICPFLVLSFPLFIITFTFGIAIYAAFVQLSWSFINWKIEVSSLEKGFYGWLCGKIGLEDCSPYTVIELFGGDVEQTPTESSRGERVAVSYAERNNSRRSRSSQGNRRSLPSDSRHCQMERVESTM